jgi:hypothetical protein
VETAGDHEVQDEEEFFVGVIVGVEDEDDALAEAAEALNYFAFNGMNGWDGGAKQKRAGDAQLLEWLADDAWRESGEVCGDVGKLGHAS